MRTLASVEIEIMLILGLPCCLSSSSVRCLENVVESSRMSTPVFVDLEISTQADGAQSSRVPLPLPEDPYKAIRQAYLDGTNTESEPFEDPVETETPESPYTIAPPTSLPESTPPTLVPILRRTTCMVVHVPPAMSLGLFASMADVAAMFDSAFCKRFRSFYKSLPSSSPPDLPLRKRYRGTSELVEDDEEEEAVHEDQQWAILVVRATVNAPLGLGYGALRRQELAVEEDHVYSTQPTLTTWTDPEDGIVYIDVPAYPPPVPPAQIPPSPEWSSSLLPISPAPSIVPSPMIPLTIPLLVSSPAMTETEGYLTESLEHEQERVAVTLGALWRPVLALESWADQTDA
ncbi:hypothetical protein Tco_0878499 [Tanacetum coccineum]|uniref:Uncharacterized protein n=1 Tax=Tanacetum coccineum TaxID=301880 RepID=A0ABQ5BZN9_9ASTR